MSIKRLWILPVLALLLYSAWLMWTEASTSQEYVRRYFTDIGHPAKVGYFAAPTGDTIFYAVNTSLSSFLLGAAGMLLLFAGFEGRQPWTSRETLYVAQAGMFLWLSADDRFMLHETIGAALKVPSTLILVAAVLVNAGIYVALFRPSYFNLKMALLLAAAGFAFAIMMLCDVALPHDMPLRLSFEDLSKTWSGFAFLAFAWEAARFRLVGVAAGEEGLRLPPVLLAWLPQGRRA